MRQDVQDKGGVSEADQGGWWRWAWQVARGRARSVWRPQHLVLSDAGEGFMASEAAVAGFGLWCEAHPGAACVLGLSSKHLLHTVCQDHADAARAQALRQWMHYLDLDESAWQAQWVLRELRLPGHSLLCAAPRALLEGLVAKAQLHGVAIEWMGPWWTRALQVWLQALQATAAEPGAQQHIALQEPDWVTQARAQWDDTGRVRLTALWTERLAQAEGERESEGEAGQPPLATGRWRLCPEPMAAGEGPAWQDLVWQQPAITAALQGRPEEAAA